MLRIFSQIIRISLLLGAGIGFAAGGTHGEVPVTTNLDADSRLSAQKRLPLLLMISQDHCPFCETLKAEIIRPMIISGDYEQKVIIRELIIDLGGNVIAFDGKNVDSREFAHGYGVYFTPTLLFLDPTGKELSERIIGVRTLEMFSYYVDEAIDQALAKLRQE